MIGCLGKLIGACVYIAFLCIIGAIALAVFGLVIEIALFLFGLLWWMLPILAVLAIIGFIVGPQK